MNWDTTTAQRDLYEFLDTPVSIILKEETSTKPRNQYLSDSRLLSLIAERWRELERPPSCEDLTTVPMAAIKKRFRRYSRALLLAGDLLSEEERENLTWTCKWCGRRGFKDSRGWRSHERFCKRR